MNSSEVVIMSSQSHGIIQPNPVLCEVQIARPRHVLGHELGLGSACHVCGDTCPGFQYHYWRKICVHCGCGVEDHDIEDEEDYIKYFVGKISERSGGIRGFCNQRVK